MVETVLALHFELSEDDKIVFDKWLASQAGGALDFKAILNLLSHATLTKVATVTSSITSIPILKETIIYP